MHVPKWTYIIYMSTTAIMFCCCCCRTDRFNSHWRMVTKMPITFFIFADMNHSFATNVLTFIRTAAKHPLLCCVINYTYAGWQNGDCLVKSGHILENGRGNVICWRCCSYVSTLLFPFIFHPSHKFMLAASIWIHNDMRYIWEFARNTLMWKLILSRDDLALANMNNLCKT